MSQTKQMITVRSYVGRDGILHLDVPVGIQDSDLEVTVIVQPVSGKSGKNSPEALGWSPGFFEETFGAWEGEALTRSSQPAVSPEAVLQQTAGTIPDLERPPQSE